MPELSGSAAGGVESVSLQVKNRNSARSYCPQREEETREKGG